MEAIRRFEEKEELKEDGRHLREFQKEITATQNKMLDELHMEFIEEHGLTDIKDLELIRKAFNFIKRS